MGYRHTVHRARDAAGQVAQRAEAGNDIALRVEVHIASAFQRGLFPKIQRVALPVRRPEYHKAATADVARRGMHHRQCEFHRDRCVHGISAFFQNIGSHLRGVRMRRCGHPVLGHNARTIAEKVFLVGVVGQELVEALGFLDGGLGGAQAALAKGNEE